MSGQEFTLPVPVTLDQLKRGDRAGIRTAFDKLYEHRYAHHSPEEPVEMVNIRLGAIGKRPKLAFPSLGASARQPAGERRLFLSARPSRKVYRRALGAERRAALIQEHGTTRCCSRTTAEGRPSGELIVTIGGAR